MPEELNASYFVPLFRSAAPYINLFRGKTFVIAFGGQAVTDTLARHLAYDINLLRALGIQIVLVHGAYPQIEEELREKDIPSEFHAGFRVTTAAMLDCVIDAVGSVYIEMDALLSQGLPNTPMANNTTRVISGNFITSRPIGVLDGVDMQYTGHVRKIDVEGIRAQLSLGNIVLFSTLAPSPTGEIFSLTMGEVAESLAVALHADKLVFMTDSVGALDENGALLEEMTADDAARLLLKDQQNHWLSGDIRRYLPRAVAASRAGVGRVHLISYLDEGSLLKELFSRDGVGTIVTREALELLRDARPDDISGLLALIEPLEEDGTLVRRSREVLEQEIMHFSVIEHDKQIVGCAALYPYGNAQAELACVAVNKNFRRYGYGEQLMKRIEARARQAKIKSLFVLTTFAEHWFLERGFTPSSLDELPEEKRLVYNLQRRSKIFAKAL